MKRRNSVQENAEYTNASLSGILWRIAGHVVLAGVLAGAWLGTPLFVNAERGLTMQDAQSITDRHGKELLLYQESHALLIGVSEYTNSWPRLPGVQGDVRAVKMSLENLGFHVIVVMNPDRDTLERAFSNFISQYGHKPENRLLFYFAGHGHTMKLAYGSEMGYIIPADAPLPEGDPTGFLTTAMDMQMIEVYAKRIQAKHALFLFDSCFSGSLFAISRAVPESISSKTAQPVRQFITSGSANEAVPDESVFRRQFIVALNGEADRNNDGYVTGSELGIFLEDTVINYTRGAQHPQYGKIREPHLDKGDFVFQLPQKPTPTPTAPATPERLPMPEFSLGALEVIADMEEAFNQVTAYEQRKISAELKVSAWQQFLQTFERDIPSSTRDDALRNVARAKIQDWQESLLPTPTPIPEPPTPTPLHTQSPTPIPVPTATLQPPTPIPTPTPEPIFQMNEFVIKDSSGKEIQPVEGIYTLKAGEIFTMSVDVTIPQHHTIRYTWEAGDGKVSSKNRNTTTYKAEKIDSDYVIVFITNTTTNEMLEKAINITIVP